MNIHEHQAKDILKKFGVNVPNGIVIFSLDEIDQKFKILKTSKIILKAQIHAGGRGKAGCIKIVNNISELKNHAKNGFLASYIISKIIYFYIVSNIRSFYYIFIHLFIRLFLFVSI